ncbi:hypothetical protein C8R46DRAFT_1341551 [Mycena filopes]|nr:hypothetical protein C8R46DRAFT_1341551 [Mycena filopes]
MSKAMTGIYGTVAAYPDFDPLPLSGMAQYADGEYKSFRRVLDCISRTSTMLSITFLLSIILHSIVGTAGASTEIVSVPTTTDFPPPNTTNPNSPIAQKYLQYTQFCGKQLQEETEASASEYEHQFGHPPADTTSPEFLTWAYNNVVPWAGIYSACNGAESDYKALLATFTPDAAPSTAGVSSQATKTGSPSSTATVGGGGGGTPQAGGASTVVPEVAVLLLTTVVGAVAVLG